MSESTTETQDITAFRARAREWLRQLTERFDPSTASSPGEEGGAAGRQRAEMGKAIQHACWEAGFAGITFPAEYGGLGLSVAYRDAFNAEIRAAGNRAVALFNLAGSLWGLSIGMIAPTMLEFATEDQKRTYIPQMLRGEKLWVQMLSEPTGGSDLAGAITRATRDGDRYVINGSKVWTSQADFSDMAVLLARTNWDVPKHHGLTMFIISLTTPGLAIHPLRLAAGGTGFCQEFFDDMAVPATDTLGQVDDGWNVATRLLVHERNTVGGGSVFHSMAVGSAARPRTAELSGAGLTTLARRRGIEAQGDIRQKVAEDHVLSTVSGQLAGRVAEGMAKGLLPPAAGSILRLFASLVGIHASDTSMDIAGTDAVVWPADRSAPGSALGLGYLGRQGGTMASGTAEIQRNIISERVLGLPREPAADRGVPFNQIRHNTMPATR